jgi:ABC-2 type transport system permease protein
MEPFWALIRKQVHESRWTLCILAAVLFGLGWLSVYVTSLNESRIVQMLGSGDDIGGRIEWMRRLGIGAEPTSIEIMMAFWNHPFFLILVSIWSISRGSGAVAAEVERGTMDLLLSRPVSRTTYLASQVLVAMAGLAVLAIGLAAGGSIAVRYNTLRVPPGAWLLIQPAANLAALGLPVYGYTLLASSFDHVRWRPTWIGSSLTLAGFIAHVIAMIPVFSDMWWKPWLERVSIFRAYNPVELVVKGETFSANLALLAGVGAPCIVLAFIVFVVWDLPANG